MAVMEDMKTTEDVDLVELMNTRARSYGMLARLFREEVDLATLRELQGMRFPQATGNAAVDEGYHQLYDYLKRAWDDSVTELAVDYVSTFIGHGVNGYSAAYPFESVYTSPKRLTMQDARDEVLMLYRAAGLEKLESEKEAEDHIAYELEFMAILTSRTIEVLRKGDEELAVSYLLQQRNFLEDHLLRWYPMMADDIAKFAKTSFYRGVGLITLGFLNSDAEFLNDLLEDAEDETADENLEERDA